MRSDDPLRIHFSTLSTTKATDLVSQVVRLHYVPPVLPGLTDDEPLRRWQEEVLTLLKAPALKRRVIWVWSSESETGKSSFATHLASMYTEAALKFPGSTQYGWEHLIKDYTRLIMFDVERAATEDLDAMAMPTGQPGSFGTVTFSLADRQQARDVHDEERKRKGFLTGLCKNLEMVSNHGAIISSKNTGSAASFNGHVLVFSNHSPADVRARLPYRILEVKASKQMPPDDQECVIVAVKTKADGTNDPEKANFEWVPSADPVAE